MNTDNKAPSNVTTRLRQYPFNERSEGIFANDFRDRDGVPVSDTFGATLRAVLQGRAGREWSVAQTANLISQYSSEQMASLMEVVKVRSLDDEWRFRYQDKGLADTDELKSILSSRWPQTFRPADDKDHPLPAVVVEVEPNVFSFYVSEKSGKKMVRIHQFTDFRGTLLEDDFPFGSSNEWSAGMPKTFSDMDAINAAGRSLIKDWASLPKSFPAAEAPPYDPNDMDAAVAYSQRTKALFAAGDHDGAYALYMSDPNGGAQPEFSQTKKEHFVVGMYNGRDVQGKPVYPQPEGYQYAGFTVGHEAHLRDDNSWAKIGHLFEFDGKPYVMLEFEQPVSTFTDGDGRLQVLRGVAAAESPAARDTRLLVAADQIDGTRPVADRALHLKAAPDIKWIADEDKAGDALPKAVGFLSDGSKVAVRCGNEVTTLDEVVERLREQHKGDDLPILLEAFGVDYDAACDAVFGDDHGRALAMLRAATASPTTALEGREHCDDQLSEAQRTAVVAFRDANGRDWKEKLGALWMNGNYTRRGIDMDQAALLQQVRNQFGPEWLSNVTRADLDAKQVEHDDADLSM